MVDLNRQEELRAAIELFYFGYRGFTDRADRILERRGLGRVHHRILYFVGRNPEVSVKGLLEILGVSKQAINAPLRQLTEMKLVAMAASAADRRVKALRLTADGARLEAELTGTQMRQLAAAFEVVGEGREAGWREVMRQIAGGSSGS